MTGKFLAADQKEYCVTYTGTLKFQPQGETSVIDQPVNTKFIGGQAIYKGPDPSFGDLGWVQLELYDAEPDPEMGTILVYSYSDRKIHVHAIWHLEIECFC